MSNSKEAMEFIWERIPKQKDGNTIKYIEADIHYLYLHGFVDSRRFELKTWKKAFQKFKTEEGIYILNKTQFLALRLFRYSGPSDHVFDPKRLQEGPWPDASLQRLYDESIIKTSELSEEGFWAYCDSLKKDGHVNEDGHLIIDALFQHGLLSLIEHFPSPRRRLEKEVDRLKKEREEQMSGSAKNKEKSGFTVGQTKGESTTKDFKSFLSTKSPDQVTETEVDEDKETLDLKALRKPKGNFRG